MPGEFAGPIKISLSRGLGRGVAAGFSQGVLGKGAIKDGWKQDNNAKNFLDNSRDLKAEKLDFEPVKQSFWQRILNKLRSVLSR